MPKFIDNDKLRIIEQPNSIQFMSKSLKIWGGGGVNQMVAYITGVLWAQRFKWFISYIVQIIQFTKYKNVTSDAYKIKWSIAKKCLL